MLERITLKNFKLHASTEIDAAPITVFIGPNNSGKSSISQAILCLRQAALRADSNLLRRVERGSTSLSQPYFFAPEESLNIGEFEDVARVRGGDIEIGLTGRAQARNAGSFLLSFAVLVRNNELTFHRGDLRAGSSSALTWEWLRASGIVGPASLAIQRDGVVLRFRPSSNFQLLEGAGIEYQQRAPSTATQLEITEALESFSNAPLMLLRSAHPVFPVRGFEEWAFPLPEEPSRSLDRLVLADRTLSLASVLAYKDDVEQSLSDWLEKLLEVRIKKVLLPGRRVAIRAIAVGKGPQKLFLNEGTGASQLPFILVPVGLASPGDSIFLSEPEAHLHPKLQSKLVSLLLRIGREENKQFFLETHSEHVLHALLHAVAKGELSQSDLAIYYFENVDGEAKVTRLKIDERGGVEGGLPGFFDHALTELSELLETSKRK